MDPVNKTLKKSDLLIGFLHVNQTEKISLMIFEDCLNKNDKFDNIYTEHMFLHILKPRCHSRSEQ